MMHDDAQPAGPAARSHSAPQTLAKNIGNVIWRAVCGAVFAASMASPASAGLPCQTSKPFVVYESLLYRNLPDLRRFGILHARTLYENQILPAGGSMPTQEHELLRRIRIALAMHEPHDTIAVDI